MLEVNSPSLDTAREKRAIIKAIKEVIKSERYVLGEKVLEFEEKFSRTLSINGCVGVANGTDAITIALRALEIRHGSEVITVGNSALATIAAIIDAGGVPVVVDVDENTGLISMEEIKRSITSSTRAIVVVHLFGSPVNVPEIQKIISGTQIKIIEDCAQAHGAKMGDKFVGTLGDIGCFSFYPTKILGGIGDGGCIVSNNESLLKRVREIREYGWNSSRIATNDVGFNSRLDELQAAVLIVKINNFELDFHHRTTIAKYYLNNLDFSIFEPLETSSEGLHAYHLFVGKIDNRNENIKKLRSKEIATGIHYETTILDHPGYESYIRVGNQGIPNSTKLSKKLLSLPMSNYLGMKDVKRVCREMNSL
jgi:dTDP-4-amino-4,6-dideoxygalactose transaminase